MPTPLFVTAYVSDAVREFSKEDLLDLLATSRVNNARNGVTGLLLHSSGNFFQALEGPEDAVRATLARIERNPRHRNMAVLFYDHTLERMFTDWAMGFEEAHGLSDETHPGLSRFMQRDGTIPAGDHAVLELLRSFQNISAHG